MKTNWQPLSTEQPGVSRYKSGFSRAEIHRQEDGSAEATLKEGFLGLGTHVSSFHKSPAPDDQAILTRLTDTAHPPRFGNWQETKDGKWEGEKAGGGKVKAEITRTGDEADVKASTGFFGTQIEGHFFAPAPTDREILRRISS